MLAPISPPPVPRSIAFSPFVLDLVTGRLLRDGDELALAPRELAVLRHLVVRAGTAVSADELLADLWSDVSVDRGVVKVVVRRIRSVLASRRSIPDETWIETRPHEGYVFLADTEWCRESASHASSERASAEIHVVGREAETASLQRAHAEACKGRRQAVWVTGEVGIGKTTLLRAFLHGAAADAAVWPLLGHASNAFAAGEPHHPILEALERALASPAAPDLAPLLRRHAPGWWNQLTDAPGRGIAGVLRAGAVSSRESSLRELARFIEAASAIRPIVLALDDLHWADGSTLEALLHLLRRPEAARLLVVGTHRPEDAGSTRPALSELMRASASLHGCEALPLARLSRPAVARFVEIRAPGVVVSDAMTDALHLRSDGNPLFLAGLLEVAVERGLVGSGAGASAEGSDPVRELERELPERIRDLVEQRFDALASADRTLLEAASAAGTTASAATLAAVLGLATEEVEARCETLVARACFLTRAGTEDWPDGTLASAYAFLHPLQREIVYGRVPGARRRSLHRDIGGRLAAAYGARAAEIAPTLAAHCEGACDLTGALTQHEIAAASALQRHAHHEADAHLVRALEILPGVEPTEGAPARELRAQMMLAVARTARLGYAAPAVECVWDRAHELCEALGDAPGLDVVRWGLWGYHVTRGEIARATRDASMLHEHAESSGVDGLRVPALIAMANTAFHRGEITTAVALHDRLESLHHRAVHSPRSPLYGIDLGALAAAYAGVTLTVAGNVDHARRRLRDAIALARASQAQCGPLGLALALHMSASVHLHLGEIEAGETHSLELDRLATENGLAHWVALARVALGWARLQRGDARSALVHVHEGSARYADTGARMSFPYVCARIADVRLATDAAAAALEAVDEGLADANERGEHWYDAELWRIRAQIAHRMGDAGTEETSARHALDVALAQGGTGYGMRAAAALAQILAAQGRHDEARAVLGRFPAG